MAKGKYDYWLGNEGLTLLEGWARDGLTDEQIAKNMNIAESTLYDWKKKYPEISEALKKGKEVVDRQVENALLKRALGYTYEEVTMERIVDTGQKNRHGGETKLTEKEWEFAQLYFGGKCCYCGTTSEHLTKDHLNPLSNGGTMEKGNIVPCCQSCNSSKKDQEWLSWFQKQPFYRQDHAQKIVDYIQLVLRFDFEESSENTELVITKKVIKQVIPDTTAQIFWLKNRKPEMFRDKQNIEHSLDAESAGVSIQVYLPDNGRDKDEK